MAKAFYAANTPEEALEIYFKGYADLYGVLKNESIKRILCSLIDLKPPLKIFEVGAGGGIWTDFFIKKGVDVTCVDICEQVLRGNARLHNEARFVVGDAATIKLKEKFDIIFVKDVIEHIRDDKEFLENMNKHLKMDGLILITTQNSFSLGYFFEGSWNFLRGDTKWCGWDPTHIRFYTQGSLRRKMDLTGFKIFKWFGSYHFPYRFVSALVSGKVVECRIFHIVEILNLFDKFPFNVTGWSIGIVAKKIREV